MRQKVPKMGRMARTALPASALLYADVSAIRSARSFCLRDSEAAGAPWVLSLPIPPRLLLAAQPKLVTPVLQVVRRVITRFLLERAGLKSSDADSDAVNLIQGFGSAANLNIYLHCLVLDGVCRRGSDGEPVLGCDMT